MTRAILFVLAGLCLAIALSATTTGCGNNGPVAPTFIILTSPTADSEWPTEGTLVIEGVYTIKGAPAPKGTKIEISVFFWFNEGTSSPFFDPEFDLVGDDGKFHLEIELGYWSWPPGQYEVQIFDNYEGYSYQSPKFSIVE